MHQTILKYNERWQDTTALSETIQKQLLRSSQFAILDQTLPQSSRIPISSMVNWMNLPVYMHRQPMLHQEICPFNSLRRRQQSLLDPLRALRIFSSVPQQSTATTIGYTQSAVRLQELRITNRLPFANTRQLWLTCPQIRPRVHSMASSCTWICSASTKAWMMKSLHISN